MNKPKKIRTYSELITLSTYEDRLNYLKLNNKVGEDTFGFDRYMNQDFYRSAEWKNTRNKVITRDLGHDMGIDDHEIYGKIIVHHMNPISKDDIDKSTDFLLDPEYLICVSSETHNMIHYGIENQNRQTFVERKPNDTCPWKK